MSALSTVTEIKEHLSQGLLTPVQTQGRVRAILTEELGVDKAMDFDNRIEEVVYTMNEPELTRCVLSIITDAIAFLSAGQRSGRPA